MCLCSVRLIDNLKWKKKRKGKKNKKISNQTERMQKAGSALNI